MAIRKILVPSDGRAPGRTSEALVRRGRVSDLVVAARPRKESPLPEALEVALLDCRRPLLVAPPKPGPSLGRKLVVGWIFDRQIGLIRGGTRPTAPAHDGKCGANALRATIVGKWREPSGESRFWVYLLQLADRGSGLFLLAQPHVAGRQGSQFDGIRH